jgi:hypothetical protein
MGACRENYYILIFKPRIHFTPQKENREMENDVGRVSRTTTGTKPIQVDDNTTL